MRPHPRRIRRVSLVAPDDMTYRRYCGQQAAYHMTFRPKQPASATQRLACLLEEVIRMRLSESVPLLPNRILSYEAQDSSGRFVHRYREIDAVAGQDQRPQVFFEIKVSCNPTIVREARLQLVKSAHVASARWPAPALCVVFANTGKAAVEGSLSSFAHLDEVEALADSQPTRTTAMDVQYVHIPAVEAWQQACAQGMVPDQSLWDQAQHELQIASDYRKQKQALTAAGVPRDDWPEHLLPSARLPASSNMVCYDASGPKMTLGDLLAEARSSAA